VSGRFLTFWCWLGGHGEPLWHSGPKGPSWRCPDCQRVRVSPVLRELAR
jgi:hypothetical protein